MAARTTPVGTTPVWQVPFSGGRTNSRSFGGPRSSGRHAGVDIPAPIGSPVYAIDNGTVVGRWTSSSGYGNIVDVEYPDGTVHRFAHLSGAPVAVGTKVPPGTVIGYAGVSGNANSRFQHVHHEVIEKAHYNAGEAVKDEAGNVIGRRFYGRETAGREDPRLYYMGYKGPNAVAEFQQAAKQAGVYTGEIDGKDGPLTQLAIANGATQLARNAPASGINPETAQSAIASLLPPQGGTLAPAVRAGAEAYAPFLPPPSPGQAAISDLISPPSTASSSDVDKLAGVMLAEARGEGRDGMLGVGNVVLNRAQAGGNRFPKSIDGVINNEFAKPLGPNDVSPEEWVEARDLATQLKNGAIPDNTGGAVYFANTATSNPNAYAEIANSGPVSATIGNHTFHTDAKIGAVARGTGDLTADQIDELTRTDVAGNYTNPLVAPPLGRRPGPGGALGVDLGQQPAGMPPPPSRPGNFDWLGGGAPPAAMVPPPGISPLRPAFGGPGDRRPQPPIPPSRASGLPLPPMRPGNFDYMGGGAPDAVGLPLPPSRPMGMPPSAPQSPVGAFSGSSGPMSLEALLSPGRAPQAARDAVLAGLQDDSTSLPWRERIGQEGPVRPRTRMENAEMNLWRPDFSLAAGGNLGTPETQLSLDRPPPHAPSAAPDFASADPSVMLPPPWAPVTSFPGETLAMGANEEPISGAPEFDTRRFDDAFGVPPIPEVSAGGTVFKSPAETKAIQQAIAQGSPIDLRPPAQVAAEQAPTPDPAAAVNVPRQPIVAAAAAAAAAPAKTAEERKRGGLPSFLAPFFGGGGVAGFLGGFGAPPSFTAYGPQNEGWMNGRMNTPMGSFRTSGTAPYGNRGGTTNWTSGTSSNALGGSNALRWTGSNGQTITAYTDPNTGQTFHSFS